MNKLIVFLCLVVSGCASHNQSGTVSYTKKGQSVCENVKSVTMISPLYSEWVKSNGEGNGTNKTVIFEKGARCE